MDAYMRLKILNACKGEPVAPQMQAYAGLAIISLMLSSFFTGYEM